MNCGLCNSELTQVSQGSDKERVGEDRMKVFNGQNSGWFRCVNPKCVQVGELVHIKGRNHKRRRHIVHPDLEMPPTRPQCEQHWLFT